MFHNKSAYIHNYKYEKIKFSFSNLVSPTNPFMTIIASAKPPPPHPSTTNALIPRYIDRWFCPFLSTGGRTCTWYLQAKQFWGSWRLADRHPTGILNHWYFLMQRWCRFIIYLSFIYLFIVFIYGGGGTKTTFVATKFTPC